MRSYSCLLAGLLLLLLAAAQARKESAVHKTSLPSTRRPSSQHGEASPRAHASRRNPKKLPQDEEDALLRGEHLLHVRPRNATSVDSFIKDRNYARIGKKSSARELIKGLKKAASKMASLSKAERKEMKKREHSKARQRTGKKYDSKKHGVKKSVHKDKKTTKKRQEHAKEKKIALDKIAGLVKERKERQTKKQMTHARKPRHNY